MDGDGTIVRPFDAGQRGAASVRIQAMARGRAIRGPKLERRRAMEKHQAKVDAAAARAGQDFACAQRRAAQANYAAQVAKRVQHAALLAPHVCSPCRLFAPRSSSARPPSPTCLTILSDSNETKDRLKASSGEQIDICETVPTHQCKCWLTVYEHAQHPYSNTLLVTLTILTILSWLRTCGLAHELSCLPRYTLIPTPTGTPHHTHQM